MYFSLLVPLDRSSFSEQALPLALSLARKASARLDLVTVHVPYYLSSNPRAGRGYFDSERDAEYKQQEQLYLDATAEWVAATSPVSISTGVLPGLALLPESLADCILERARSGNADLIVMATHGRGPLSRIAHGSIADQLIRRGTVPVLLVRPGENESRNGPAPMVDNILIPLDGSELSERALEPAVNLARLLEARCTLFRVIESHSSSDELGSERPGPAQAEAYLEGVAERIRVQGLHVQTRVVVARQAAEAIIEEAAATANNLIALATHGWGGFKRLVLGSVADRLVRCAQSPVLVYHPSMQER